MKKSRIITPKDTDQVPVLPMEDVTPHVSFSPIPDTELDGVVYKRLYELVGRDGADSMYAEFVAIHRTTGLLLFDRGEFRPFGASLMKTTIRQAIPGDRMMGYNVSVPYRTEIPWVMMQPDAFYGIRETLWSPWMALRRGKLDELLKDLEAGEAPPKDENEWQGWILERIAQFTSKSASTEPGESSDSTSSD